MLFGPHLPFSIFHVISLPFVAPHANVMKPLGVTHSNMVIVYHDWALVVKSVLKDSDLNDFTTPRFLPTSRDGWIQPSQT